VIYGDLTPTPCFDHLGDEAMTEKSKTEMYNLLGNRSGDRPMKVQRFWERKKRNRE
jgi:hypothetical protein